MFDLGGSAPSFELAAVFLSTLAYPNDKRSADRFGGAIVCAAVAFMASDSKRYGEPPEALRLACAVRDITSADKEISKGCRIISDQRLVAAKMAFPKMHAHVCEKLGIPYPPTVPTHTSIEMISAISIDLGHRAQKKRRGRQPSGGEPEGNKGNIISRCWNPSLPVLHMAIVLSSAIVRDPILNKNNGINIGDILFDLDFCFRLINDANFLRPIVLNQFNLDPSRQVTFSHMP